MCLSLCVGRLAIVGGGGCSFAPGGIFAAAMRATSPAPQPVQLGRGFLPIVQSEECGHSLGKVYDELGENSVRSSTRRGLLPSKVQDWKAAAADLANFQTRKPDQDDAPGIEHRCGAPRWEDHSGEVGSPCTKLRDDLAAGTNCDDFACGMGDLSLPWRMKSEVDGILIDTDVGERGGRHASRSERQDMLWSSPGSASLQPKLLRHHFAPRSDDGEFASGRSSPARSVTPAWKMFVEPDSPRTRSSTDTNGTGLTLSADGQEACCSIPCAIVETRLPRSEQQRASDFDEDPGPLSQKQPAGLQQGASRRDLRLTDTQDSFPLELLDDCPAHDEPAFSNLGTSMDEDGEELHFRRLVRSAPAESHAASFTEESLVDIARGAPDGARARRWHLRSGLASGGGVVGRMLERLSPERRAACAQVQVGDAESASPLRRLRESMW